jgi:hypothetical protein
MEGTCDPKPEELDLQSESFGKTYESEEAAIKAAMLAIRKEVRKQDDCGEPRADMKDKGECIRVASKTDMLASISTAPVGDSDEDVRWVWWTDVKIKTRCIWVEKASK